MSSSIRNFFNDVEDAVNRAVDDVERGVDDIVDDVTGRDDAPSTTSRAAQVTRLYDTAFDRQPDDAGLVFWTNALRTGVAELDDLAELFVASPEFRNRYGDLGNGEFVALLYRNVLDREADPEGLAFWTAEVQSGRADRDDVVLAFSESPEHVAKVGPVSTDDNPFI